jgi:hypothetical protein
MVLRHPSKLGSINPSLALYLELILLACSENRLLTAGGVTYTYDGDGRRIKKSSGKLYWYGEGIEVLDDLAFILSFQSRVSLENSGSH